MKTIASPYARGPRSRMPEKDDTRINDMIDAAEVRLIGPEGEQVGVVALRRAQQMADEAGLDLVEIAAGAEPPVCKVMDYGKYRFEQQKKQQAAKKNQQTTQVKEITIRPGTEEHDYQVKLRKIRQFLESGDKVKVTVRFRGREMAHTELGMEQITRIKTDTAEMARIESEAKIEGRHMHMMLAPTSSKK